MAKHIERQIEHLKERILRVGTLVEEAISKSITALINRDLALSRRVIANDDEIDRMEVEVEEECLKILALYQPVAADLRFVVAVLKINNDLERLGDLAEHVAKKVLFLAKWPPLDFRVDFRAMAAKAQSMVKRSLDALVNRDALLARQVRDQDDEVDIMQRSLRQQIESQLRDHPERADELLKLISIARHLERLADMACNIAEDVIYMVEGEIVRHHRTNE